MDMSGSPKGRDMAREEGGSKAVNGGEDSCGGKEFSQPGQGRLELGGD